MSHLIDIIYLPYLKFLQKIMNYAGPTLVSVETVKELTHSSKVASNKVWYYVIVTTRILIAHCSLMTSENTQILNIVAHNIRNLYRLFGMDLSERRKWRCVNWDGLYYALPNHKGKFSIELGRIDQLKIINYATVLIEFNDEEPDLKQYIGHCIYNLVGTSEEK